MMLKFICLFSFIVSFGLNATICGQDDRVLSSHSEIGNVSFASGNCTISMISRSCAITAGHCKIALGSSIEFMSFNFTSREHHYRVHRKSIRSSNKGLGDDWAVFRFKPNRTTGFYPGEA